MACSDSSTAAAVGIGISAGRVLSGCPVAFSRPYLMVVTDTQAGEPLFHARVADPAAP
jgi:hypothetical protein